MMAEKMIAWLLLSFAVQSVLCAQKPLAGKKNVLLIAMDDMRPIIGAYGADYVKSPNLDKLASNSMLFERAYCQVAVCSPTRTSLLTGRRPDTTHVWGNSLLEYWRKTVNATTIPQYFKENGYISIGMGKVFHPGAPSGFDDVLHSWSPEGLPYYHSPLHKIYGPSNKSHIAWEAAGFEDNQLPDGQIAEHALGVLDELKENRTEHGETRPFFLAVGFHKPHVPFIAPKRYFDLYPPQEEIALPKNPIQPEGMPLVAWSIWPGFNLFGGIAELFNGTECFSNASEVWTPRCRMPKNTTQWLRRAYYSAMSYSDAMVGKVLEKLDETGFSNDTLVVMFGDHGWQLGEHGEWAKYTNFEDGTHVPFMLRVPGVTDKGMRTKALVELIDIYPTLAELAGLPVPEQCPPHSQNVGTCHEGASLVPLLDNAEQKWKNASFSQFPRPACGLWDIPGLVWPTRSDQEAVMGYTIRTDTYRYTEWVGFNNKTAVANWTDVKGRELYSHQQPTELFNDENVNMVDQPSMQGVVQELHEMLLAGWRAALPAVR